MINGRPYMNKESVLSRQRWFQWRKHKGKRKVRDGWWVLRSEERKAKRRSAAAERRETVAYQRCAAVAAGGARHFVNGSVGLGERGRGGEENRGEIRWLLVLG
ncbi:hypothetical protein HAX54_049337 [Datura stramonium]|uniref:Uncharacterized protein n=1 Tax=Datura stramonium TaxID=4076 RepID=A0ABS8SUT5_DATST|nr:hypothetical protein [Datura stramonium]